MLNASEKAGIATVLVLAWFAVAGTFIYCVASLPPMPATPLSIALSLSLIAEVSLAFDIMAWNGCKQFISWRREEVHHDVAS